MRIHILGICGTFMSGVAVLAKQCGHEVVGSDQNVYPPMSTQLEEQGITLHQGFDAANLGDDVDCVIVGNVITRGNLAVEEVLNRQIPYFSGPEWLAANVLRSRQVLAVAGTHGKTTTTSMLAWILEQAGLNPGFLVGGVPENFGVSARLGRCGNNSWFVIEADEYDSAFFDKRSKFLHYRPKTAILNNLEYDHADIFPDLAAIKQQFHHLIKTIPANGNIIRHAEDANLESVLSMGCWSPATSFGLGGGEWRAELIRPDGSEFKVIHKNQVAGTVRWDLLGNHNVNNALAAIAAAGTAGVAAQTAVQALYGFKNVKRRMEIKGQINDVTVYDDFAHHPTAIATTLAGLRAKIGQQSRLIAVIEFGSFTMRAGVHKEHLQDALGEADMVVCRRTDVDWGLEGVLKQFKQPASMYNDVDSLVQGLAPQLKPGDHVLVMSNSGFGGIHSKLLAALQQFPLTTRELL